MTARQNDLETIREEGTNVLLAQSLRGPRRLGQSGASQPQRRSEATIGFPATPLTIESNCNTDEAENHAT